jgi:hypothetical protein
MENNTPVDKGPILLENAEQSELAQLFAVVLPRGRVLISMLQAYDDGKAGMRMRWLLSCIFVLTVLFSVSGQPPGGKRPGILKALPKGPDEILAFEGEITENDLKDQPGQGNYAKRVPVKFEEGKTYQIDMSSAILALLRLVDKNGKELASDRTTAGIGRPRIIHEAKTSGIYVIVCTSSHTRPETGGFSVRVKVVTSDPKELAKPLSLKLENGRASVDAELEMRGPRYKGAPCKFLSVDLNAGVAYKIEMSSREFTCHVFVEDADGTVLAEDRNKDGEQRPTGVLFTPKKAGTYRIVAAQYDFRSGGPQFSLSVREVKGKQ